MGGRLGLFLLQWKKVAPNFFRPEDHQRRVISYSSATVCPKEPFVSSPPRDPQKASALLSQIGVLIDQQVLVPVPPQEINQGFYAHVFVVRKPSGKFRPDPELKTLNQGSGFQEVSDGNNLHNKNHFASKLLYALPRFKGHILAYPDSR